MTGKIKKCPLFFLLALSSLLFMGSGILKNKPPWALEQAELPPVSLKPAERPGGLSLGNSLWGKLQGISPSPEETEGNAKADIPPAVEPPPARDFVTVGEDYFDNAVFIGDSRTQGLLEYGHLENRADFLCKVSLTIYDFATDPFIRDEASGQNITVEEALGRKQYGKVYIMVGINELGTGTTETFLEAYRAVVNRIRELQPDALIFVEGIMRVTGAKSESDPIYNNANINDKNNAISTLADGEGIFYIDVNEAVCDEAGNLHGEYTTDDVHLKARYYEIWKTFLMEHGI